MNPPKGCPFNTRCPRKVGAICEQEKPPLIRSESGHLLACHIPLGTLSEVEPVFNMQRFTDKGHESAVNVSDSLAEVVSI